MKKLAIIGSGHLGQLIAYHAENCGLYHVVGFFDDFISADTLVNEKPILGKISEIEACYENTIFDEIIIGVGYKHFEFRAHLFTVFNKKIPFAVIIHSSCYVDPSCNIGKGVFLLPGCVLDCNVVIGDNVLVNTGCVIAHDSEIEAHTFLSPSVSIAGFVRIGKRCNIGINTTIIDGVTIVDDVQTGGGTVVIKNIENKGLYVGNPLRFVR